MMVMLVVIVMELLWSDIPHDPRRGEPRAENVGDGVDWEEKTNPANLRMVLVWLSDGIAYGI